MKLKKINIKFLLLVSLWVSIEGLYFHKDFGNLKKIKIIIYKNKFYLSIVEDIQGENSTILRHLKITVDDQDGNFDFENSFPNEFSISFNKFEKDWNFKFLKIASSSDSHPISNSDIYVIDKISGNPVKFVLENEDVIIFLFLSNSFFFHYQLLCFFKKYEFYIEETRNGHATLIKNKGLNNNDNTYRLVNLTNIFENYNL